MIRRPRKSERVSSGSHCKVENNSTYPTDLRFILRVPWNLPKLLLPMSKLALTSVPASSFLFPAAAKFCLVETQFPVVRAWAVTIWSGVLSNSRGRGSQPAVICWVTNECAVVLVLDVPSHQLRGSEIVRCVSLRWVELVSKHGESGSTERGLRVHSRWELLKELLQRSGFAKRSGVRGRMLVGRTEGLSLHSGNSRILWGDHIVQLLCGTGGKSLHRV